MTTKRQAQGEQEATGAPDAPEATGASPAGEAQTAAAAAPPAGEAAAEQAPGGVPAEVAAGAPAATIPTQQYDNAGWAVGQRAPEARYGIIGADGVVKLTARKGAAEPKPGERGSIIVQAGDTVTHGVRHALGLTD